MIFEFNCTEKYATRLLKCKLMSLFLIFLFLENLSPHVLGSLEPGVKSKQKLLDWIFLDTVDSRLLRYLFE